MWVSAGGVGAACGEMANSRPDPFLGFRQDVPRLLRQLGAFAFSSFSEGLGLAVAEAMATGLAVIVT